MSVMVPGTCEEGGTGQSDDLRDTKAGRHGGRADDVAVAHCGYPSPSKLGLRKCGGEAQRSMLNEREARSILGRRAAATISPYLASVDVARIRIGPLAETELYSHRQRRYIRSPSQRSYGCRDTPTTNPFCFLLEESPTTSCPPTHVTAAAAKTTRKLKRHWLPRRLLCFVYLELGLLSDDAPPNPTRDVAGSGEQPQQQKSHMLLHCEASNTAVLA